MRKNGIFIGVFGFHDRLNMRMGNGGCTYCTSTDFQRMTQEAKNFLIRTGAKAVYWFQSYPYQIERFTDLNKAAEYIINNGYMVCSCEEV